jgi:hypothetical protein
MRDPKKISHQQVAEAGEHYALYRLYELGFVGGQAPRGSAETDLLVMWPDGTNVAIVQVKTRSAKPPDGGWHMQPKHERIARDNLFYVFIGLETDPPLCYVIPSKVVADVIRLSHAIWLDTPGKGRRPHKDSNVRRLCPAYKGLIVPGYQDGWIEQYRDAWHLLNPEKQSA